MCVNTHTFKCCCCLSLNQATILVGVLYSLIAISVTILGSWIPFAYCMSFVVTISTIFCKPSSVQLRKIIFLFSAMMALIGALVFIVIVLKTFAIDQDEHTCSDYVEGDPLTDYSNCWMIIFLYLVFSAGGFILIPFNLMVIEILYFGWKGLEMKEDIRQKLLSQGSGDEALALIRNNSQNTAECVFPINGYKGTSEMV